MYAIGIPSFYHRKFCLIIHLLATPTPHSSFVCQVKHRIIHHIVYHFHTRFTHHSITPPRHAPPRLRTRWRHTQHHPIRHNRHRISRLRRIAKPSFPTHSTNTRYQSRQQHKNHNYYIFPYFHNSTLHSANILIFFHCTSTKREGNTKIKSNKP